MDWDKVRIFYTVAEAGSFTRAGDDLGLSQSAVSRQVSALERELKAPLFHRHARGLILTEQGELLFRAARDMTMRLDSTRARLAESRERPSGNLRVTTTLGLGSHWLTPRLGEFLDLYPDVRVELILTDEELDLSMREADVAIRLRQPVQGDLIQRRLFTVHFHVYASTEYLKRFGQPDKLADLDSHRILTFGGPIPHYLLAAHWLATAGRDVKDPRAHHLVVNNITALKKATEKGAGIAVLPDYLVEPGLGLVQILTDVEMPSLDSYLVFPEEMKNVARVQVFRDFLISKAQRWTY
ncbi:LysR family transcriptional regulator [Chelatococcus asaccharovorans]|uniref:LysR family transcriptional regulator n=1 Tax=Chelatococcus asaccharovorans TaxID=28210 RepID=A0A2V3U1R9_9HYPH|nr:LysR family transcriptional regulator [Chelatococcus asaccharovorans]MBS7704379.1 LysR family transcriptional regulator [Chelatococcus asaccharovorans]PXW55742.1 LysR family transcriptional regulator [Chelatococcus asaccharovorans]CAH1664151.1 LysR family transcriptional regulator [Chelatococcus asaccharovorans]CAH1682530.1 LysR family transcriptional regulator [Chelatococcus asaccharovorans]